jgi:hypothetical protein
MPAAETLYSFRTKAPDVLQRGRAQTVSMPAYRDGALVAPTEVGSTFSLYDEGGTAIVDAQAVTVTGDVATYTISDVELPATATISELYQERWALVMPDGTTRTVRREAAVAPFLLHLPVAVEDLLALYPALDSSFGTTPAVTLQGFLDEAWAQVLERLWNVGHWPDLMLSASTFRRPVVELALYIAFRALFSRTAGRDGRHEALMEQHRRAAEEAWAAISSRLDRDDDGLPDDRHRERGEGVIHRNASPGRRRRRSPRW